MSTVYALDTGNVLVVEHGKEVTRSREFCRRGPCVYEVSADGSKVPARVALKATGDQLLIHHGETLEEAIRRTLEPAKPRPVDRPLDIYEALIPLTLAVIIGLAWGKALNSLFGPFWIFG